MSNTNFNRFKAFVPRLSYFAVVPILVTPLLYSDAFLDPIVAPKVWWLHTIGLLGIVLLLICLILPFGEKKLNITWLDIAFLSYALYSIVHVLYQETIHKSVLISQGLFVCFYLALRGYSSKELWPLWKVAVVIMTSCLLAQTVLCWLQLFGFFGDMTNGFLITGSFGNPGPLTNYLVAGLPVLLICQRLGQPFFKRLSVVTALLLVSLLPFTEARTAWIACVAGATYFLLSQSTNRAKLSHFVKQMGFSKTVVLIGLVLITTGAGAITMLKFKQDSADGRLFIWARSIEMIQNAPFFGVGRDNFARVYPKYQTSYFGENPNDERSAYLAGNISHAFNEFLTITAELGIVGLILLLLFIFFAFTLSQSSSSKRTIDLKREARSGIVIILCLSLFSYPMKSTSVMIMLIFYLSLIADNLRFAQVDVPKHKLIIYLSISGLLLFAYKGMQFGITNRSAEKKWNEAYTEAQSGRWIVARRQYEELYPLLKNNGKFLYNYGASLSHNGEHKLALKLLSEASDYFINTDLMCYLGNSHLALQEYKEAELSFMDAHHTIPHKIFPLYQLVQIYDTTHREHLAIEYAEKILATKVKVKSDLTMNIKREMRLFLRNKRLQ